MAKDDMIRSSGNRKRKYPGTKNNLRPDNSDFRKKEAAERKEVFDKMTLEQKLELLDARLGKGKGAARQRARYLKMIETNLSKREAEKTVENAKAAAKKDKQEKSKPAKNTK